MTQGLDQTAQNRLADAGKFFTSDLSVSEFTLLEHMGFDAIELVMGVSVFHVGFQPGRGMQAGEYQVLSQAMYTARMNAINRLVAETVKVGGDGVIGVKLGYRAHSAEALEFTAIGTAVRHRDGAAGAPGTVGRALHESPRRQGAVPAPQRGLVSGVVRARHVRLPHRRSRRDAEHAPDRSERRTAPMDARFLRRSRTRDDPAAGRRRARRRAGSCRRDRDDQRVGLGRSHAGVLRVWHLGSSHQQRAGSATTPRRPSRLGVEGRDTPALAVSGLE